MHVFEQVSLQCFGNLQPASVLNAKAREDVLDSCALHVCLSTSIKGAEQQLTAGVVGCPAQSVFNEEIFFLSHGDYKSPGVSVRVMDIYTFMNSKVLPVRLPSCLLRV